jgi:tetratricopeptide (TPR) repeat protein
MIARQRSSGGVLAAGAFRIAGLLLAATGAVSASAQSAASCDVEQAQSRFAEQPRDDAAVERLLAGCDTADGRDSRPALFRGVMARDRGDLRAAREHLSRAHRLDPANPAAALELALTEERLESFSDADAAYRAVLSHDPRSRAAILGLARVARAQWRFGDAAAHYRTLLAADPQDVDAINGLAWVALADHRVGEAERGFASVRQRFPDNVEAAAGLGATAGAWRLRADAAIGRIDTDVGSAFTSTAEIMVPLGAVDSLFVGGTYNSNQILAPTATDLSFLPKSEYVAGFQRNVPGPLLLVDRIQLSQLRWVSRPVTAPRGRRRFGIARRPALRQLSARFR